MRVILIRHGQSEWNAIKRLQGQADIGLSKLGRAQAGALRDVVAGMKPFHTIASDLRRVRETAELIGISAPDFRPGLREVDVGDWTGRAVPELIAEDGATYRGWRSGTHTPPRGEEWHAFSARTVTVLEHEINNRPCDNLLVLCHGGVIRALINHYVGIDPGRIIAVAPASLSAFIINGRGPDSAKLELFNYRPDDLDFGAPD